MTLTFDSLYARWPRGGGQENLTLASLVRRLTSDDPLHIPDYQRSVVWTDDQCSKFIGFLAEGGVAPFIYVQRWPARTGQPDEILDGLQRITAVRRFLANEVPLELIDGTRMFLRDFDERSQKLLVGNSGPTLVLRYVLCPSEADVLDLYLRLNSGGTPHAAQDLMRVREKRASLTP